MAAMPLGDAGGQQASGKCISVHAKPVAVAGAASSRRWPCTALELMLVHRRAPFYGYGCGCGCAHDGRWLAEGGLKCLHIWIVE